MVDANYQYEGVQLYAGLKAAEKEMNDADVFEGTRVSFRFFPGLSNTSSASGQAASARAATAAGDLFGFVLSDYQGSPHLYEAAGNHSPVLSVVAARSLTDFEYQAPYSYVTTLRPPAAAQYRTMLHNAFNDGWLLSTDAYNPSYAYALPSCGVEYAPLVVVAALNVGLIAGAAVPCAAVAIAATLYFSCCFGRCSNRRAPKDANAPFAMVFTDILGSTSLWARRWSSTTRCCGSWWTGTAGTR